MTPDLRFSNSMLLCTGLSFLVCVFSSHHVLASSDGYGGWNPADLDTDGLPDAWENYYFGDITSATASGDPDLDGRTNAEELVLGTHPLFLDPMAVAEVGTAYRSQPDGDYWHTVRTNGSYSDPVVIMGPAYVASANAEGLPIPIRVKDVGSSSFSFQFDSFEYADKDWVNGDKRINWLVIESGRHSFGIVDGGAQIEVESGNIEVPSLGERVTFSQPFATKPVILAQAVSRNGSRATTVRPFNVDETGFNIVLQNQELNKTHETVETISWVAMESGYIVNEFGRRQAGLVTGVTDQWMTYTFPKDFYAQPTFLSTINTKVGADTVVLWARRPAGKTIQLQLVEETSKDPETAHAAQETLGWFGTNSPGFIHVLPTPGDQDADGLPDAWEQANGLDAPGFFAYGTHGYHLDFDGDGLANWEEYRAGTKANLADSDGDGFSDFDEIRFYESDALASDVEAFQTVLTLPGSAFTEETGVWRAEGTVALIESPRGTISYEIPVTTPGVHALEARFTAVTTSGNLAAYPFSAWLDGEYIGRSEVSTSASGVVRFLTPWLSAGDHELKILWDNENFARRIRMDSIGIQEARGTDANGNGEPDWAEIRTRRQNGLITYDEMSHEHIKMPKSFQKYWKMQRQWADANQDWVAIRNNPHPRSHEFAWLASRTSPACVEGLARYSGMLDASASTVPNPLPDYEWFADIPLSPEVPFTETYTFEGNHFAETLSVFWVPTNLAAESVVNIREGDSLLLNAWVGQNPVTSRKADITIDGQLFPEVQFDEPLQHLFDTAGEHVVTWGLRQNPNSPNYAWEGSVTVSVAERTEIAPIRIAIGNERPWSITGLHPEALLKFDKKISVYDPQQISSGSWSYKLAVSDTARHYLSARLGYSGPVISTTNVEGFRSGHNSNTGIFYTGDLGDGTQIYEMPLFVGGDLSGIEVEVRIYRAGVTYVDGGTTIILTAEDFDEFGFAMLQYLVPPGTDANCHSVKISQNGVVLAYFN